MTRAIVRDAEYFAQKAQKRLLKKFPYLQFDVAQPNEHEIVLFYYPYTEEDSWPIIEKVAGVSADASDEGIRLWLFPGPMRVDTGPSDFEA